MDYGYLLTDLTYSLLRLLTAYTMSIVAALLIGIPMGRSKLLEATLYPLIDVLQSIPVLGFFPAVLLLVTKAVQPPLGAELASVILIFTGQAWNLILGVYSAVKAVPEDFLMMSAIYRFNLAARLFKIYIPTALLSIASNSIVSWAGGLFFLTACEVISLGSEEFRLRGIGADIVNLTAGGNFLGAYVGVALLTGVSLALYMLVWNPLVNAVSALAGGSAVSYPAVNIFRALSPHIFGRMPSPSNYVIYLLSTRNLDVVLSRINLRKLFKASTSRVLAIAAVLTTLTIACLVVFKNVNTLKVDLAGLPWFNATVGLLHSLFRVFTTILASFAFIAFAGFYAFEHGKVAKYILIQLGEVLSSMPAFLWWSIFSLAVENGLISPLLVSFLILFQGTAWYIFFNTPLAPPTEAERRLYEVAQIYRLGVFKRFSRIYLPSMMPRITAGLSAAWGGAWNSVIAAEYAQIGSKTIEFFGIGYLLNVATIGGDINATLFYALYLAIFIVIVNRTFWRWLFTQAFMKYRVVE